MKTWKLAIAFLCACVWPLAVQAQSTTGSDFVLDKSVEGPGTTLHAGAYHIAVLDSLQDRTLVRVSSADGKTNLLLLGVHSTLPGASGQASFWEAKAGQGRHALRGFVFNNGQGVEFVYPKADAVALAKANHSSVVAVDPASEGRPELSRLSSRDMQMVSLWLLTPTRVNSTDAIDAKRYEPPAAAASAPAVASTPVRETVPAPGRSTPAVRPARPVQTAMASGAPAPRRFDRLPQTASDLPSWMLFAVCSLVTAAGFRLRRAAA